MLCLHVDTMLISVTGSAVWLFFAKPASRDGFGTTYNIFLDGAEVDDDGSFDETREAEYSVLAYSDESLDLGSHSVVLSATSVVYFDYAVFTCVDSQRWGIYDELMAILLQVQRPDAASPALRSPGPCLVHRFLCESNQEHPPPRPGKFTIRGRGLKANYARRVNRGHRRRCCSTAPGGMPSRPPRHAKPPQAEAYARKIQ